MTEKIVIGLISKTVTGSIGIAAFGILAWIFQKKYKAQGRKNGWIFISVCLLLPFNLIPMPNMHFYSMQFQNSSAETDKNAQGANRNTEEPPMQGMEEKMISSKDDSGKFSIGISTEKILFAAWIAGVLFLAMYHAVCYYKMCRRMKRWSRECQDKAILETMEDIASKIGLKACPQIQIMEVKDGGPFTMGILKNTVFLPDGDYVGKDLHYILKHELVHCKKKDILWKLQFLTANIVHWFNPLVWLFRRLAESDLEQACDEGALGNASIEECREYSEVILAWVRGGGQCALSTGYAADKAFLKRRFANIYESRSKQKGAILVSAICIVIFAADIIANAQVGERIYFKSDVPILGGIEVRTDVDGDGKTERVYVTDNRSGDYAFTQISARFRDGNITFRDYEDYWESYIWTGDLSGNGRADVAVMKVSTGSTYGGGELTVLHMENGKWEEYPSRFLPNPSIELEQPDNFQSDNFAFSAMGAAIIEKDGKTMLRIIAAHDMTQDIAKCIDCSWRNDGWYIEDMQIIDNYYSDNKEDELLGDFF